jgi:hypothetical protein
LVVILLAVMVIYILVPKNTTTTTNTPSETTFPASGNSTTSNSSTSSGIATVSTQSGGKVATLNFIHNGTTIEDPANKGTYYLAGSSGACNSNGSCPTAGTEKDFTILYYPSNGSFNIGLASEPLGQVRIEAEQYLMKELGLSEQQMCDLKYNISTSAYVNQQYGGENLGFSFCPGAIPLPQ